MAKKGKIDLSGLETYITEYANNVARTVAGQIRDDLYDEAKLAIEEFYNSYNPKYYRRHYYNFYNKSFKKYYSNAHGTIYRGGIELTPENLDSIYRAPTDLVFETVYAGFHGPADFGYGWGKNLFGSIPNSNSISNGTWISNGSVVPMKIIEKKRDYIIDHIQQYVDDAVY